MVQEVMSKEETLLGVNYFVRQKFIKWYPENMHIINNFYHHTRKLRNKQRRETYSAGMIWEVMRWHSTLEDTDTTYKISNDFCSSTVRVIVALFPEFDGMFRMRGRVSLKQQDGETNEESS